MIARDRHTARVFYLQYLPGALILTVDFTWPLDSADFLSYRRNELCKSKL